MTDVVIVLDPLTGRVLEAGKLDFFVAAPQWAQHTLGLYMFLDTLCPGKAKYKKHHLKHIEAAISCVRNIHRNCAKQEQMFGRPDHAHRVRRNKRTRAQIRAGKTDNKKSDNDKKGKKK